MAVTVRSRTSQTYTQLLETSKLFDGYVRWLTHSSNDCLNTAQPTVHRINRPKNFHYGSKRYQNDDNKNTSNLNPPKSNEFYINKIKENIRGILSTAYIELPDLRNMLPWKSKTKNENSNNEEQPVSQSEKIYQMKKIEKIANGKDNKVDESKVKMDRENHTLEGHVEGINSGIISYYDTSTIDMTKTNISSDNSQNAQSFVKESKVKSDVVSTTSQESKQTKVDEESVLWRIFGFATSFTPVKSQTGPEKQLPIVRRDFVSRADIDRRTRALVNQLKGAKSNASRLQRIEELCKHLLEYPDSRSRADKEKVMPCILKLQKSKNADVQARASEALSLMGYVAPPRGRGIRVLTIDGGGTKGLVALRTMKKLQKACNTEIWKMFDYVCGVSTGALMCVMVFLYRLPLDEVEERYLDCSHRMFTRNKLIGTGTLFRDHAFYDTDIFEDILRDQFGEDKKISEFSVDPLCPKMSAISCITNIPKMKNYMFRTYNLPPGVYSQYPGNCKHRVWEMIRASSAAPGYYEQFTIGDYVHQDGGLKNNNPTAVAIHECKLLWPDEPLQCVISLGNGRYEPNLEVTAKKTVTIRDKVTKIIESATDTEDVHTTLEDLLPPSTYYRFNPYMSEDCPLDTIDKEKILQMTQDTDMYLRKNEHKIQKAKEQLMLSRQKHKQVTDYLKRMADTVEFNKPF